MLKKLILILLFSFMLLLSGCITPNDPRYRLPDKVVMVTVTPTPTMTPIVVVQMQTVIVTATPTPEAAKNFVYDEMGKFSLGYLIYNFVFLGASIFLLFMIFIVGRFIPK